MARRGLRGCTLGLPVCSHNTFLLPAYKDMANLVVIHWNGYALPAACDDDGTQLATDLSQVLPASGGARVLFRMKGAGARLSELQAAAVKTAGHIASGWFNGDGLEYCWRRVLRKAPNHTHCAGDHPGLHPGSAGTVMSAMRAAAGADWQPNASENAGVYMQGLRAAVGPDCASSSHLRKYAEAYNLEEENCHYGPGSEASHGSILERAPATTEAAALPATQPDKRSNCPESLGSEKPASETLRAEALKLPGVGCNTGAKYVCGTTLANGRCEGYDADSECDSTDSLPQRPCKRARIAEVGVEPCAVEIAAAAQNEAVQHGSLPQPGVDGSKEAHIAEHSGQMPDWQVLPDVGGNAECACGNLRTNGRCEDCDADLESSPYDSPPHRRYKRARRAELQIGTYAASPALEEACFAALPPTAPQAPTTSAEDAREARADSRPWPWQECPAPSDRMRADTAAAIRRHIEQRFGASG